MTIHMNLEIRESLTIDESRGLQVRQSEYLLSKKFPCRRVWQSKWRDSKRREVLTLGGGLELDGTIGTYCFKKRDSGTLTTSDTSRRYEESSEKDELNNQQSLRQILSRVSNFVVLLGRILQYKWSHLRRRVILQPGSSRPTKLPNCYKGCLPITQKRSKRVNKNNTSNYTMYLFC